MPSLPIENQVAPQGGKFYLAGPTGSLEGSLKRPEAGMHLALIGK